MSICRNSAKHCCGDDITFNFTFGLDAVREFANKSAASAADPDYVKFQAVIKSAASAASLRGGRSSGRLDHGLFLQFLGALAPKKYKKIVKISDSVSDPQNIIPQICVQALRLWCLPSLI